MCCVVRQTAYSTPRSALGAPPNPAQDRGWLPSPGRACFLASSEQCKQLGGKVRRANKTSQLPKQAMESEAAGEKHRNKAKCIENVKRKAMRVGEGRVFFFNANQWWETAEKV